MYLSLPLPESRVRSCNVIIVRVDGSRKPMKYNVEVPSVGTIKDLLYALAQVSVDHGAPRTSECGLC